MVKLIGSLSHSVPAALSELITLGRTLKQRGDDVLAYFDRPGTSNGPTEAINGRLEHLRGSALGFRNLTNYIARSLPGDRRIQTPRCQGARGSAKYTWMPVAAVTCLCRASSVPRSQVRVRADHGGSAVICSMMAAAAVAAACPACSGSSVRYPVVRSAMVPAAELEAS